MRDHSKSVVVDIKLLQRYLYQVFQTHNFMHCISIVDHIVLTSLLHGGYEYFNDYPGLYPFFQGDRRGRVAIYGAGLLGEEIFCKLQDFEVTGWFDRDSRRYAKMGKPVKSPQAIKACNFDVLIIAIQNAKVADSVKHELAGKGILQGKIYTIAPDILTSDYTRRKLAELSNVDKTYRYVSPAAATGVS